MNAERRERVEALFHGALDRPAAEREAYLAAACDDADLRETVLALLREDESAADYFEGLAGRAGALHHAIQPPPLEADALAGHRVGPYLLGHEVGRGGTSVVYAARRVEGAFERTVAVKVLMRRSGGPDLLRRFEREQQVLSGLSHPNIAGLHDGGVTEDGYPWFVMEFVDGVPLDRYCDERRLTVHERLRIFLEVVDVVQHAHRNLVIHRDLKPTNILVTDDGTVKLIDFGIARIVRGDADGGGEALTRTGARWMTPEYGAPEQVRGERTTTATDVYQLGVVLYELLTGHHPVPAAAGDSAYLTEKAVCETEPCRPSRVVSRPGERRRGRATVPLAPEDVARARRAEVRQLRDRLRGDLDAIVLRALEKDPSRRYGMAEGLADDIRRYLAGLPVEARDGSARYRARKFLARNRVPAAAAAAVLFLLVAGGALHVERVAEQRDAARLEAAKAQTVTEFMLSLFDAGHPAEARGETLTAPMLLERGVERAERLADQPAVQAEMLATVAQAYIGLADFMRADELFTRSLEIRREHLGPRHEDVAHSIAQLGWSRLLQSDFEAAAAHFRAALSIQRATLGPDHPEVANSLSGLGLALNGLGDLEPGIARIEEALAIRRRSLGAAHVELANGLNDLAVLLREGDELERAERLLREALAMRRGLLPEGHPDIGKSAQHLASLLHKMGRYASAEPLYLEALANWEKSFGPAHPSTRSTVRSLEALYTDWGRVEEAGRYATMLELVADGVSTATP